MSDSLPRITVNGQEIPAEAILYELSRLMQFYARHMSEEQVRAQLPLLRKKAIEQAIGAKLLFEEVERLGITVSDEEVSERIAGFAAEAGGPEKFAALLQQQKLAEETLRDQIRRGRRVDILVERITATAAEPGEEEIRQHFEQHHAEYRVPERVLAQHILITPADESEAAHTAARTRLEEIRQQAVGGADFADLAAKHSDCPSGSEGGSLGWFSRGMMVPEFDQVSFEMEVGALSPVIKTQFGYHIIYKSDQEAEQEADFDEAHDNVRDFLRHVRRGEALTHYVNDLREKATISEG